MYDGNIIISTEAMLSITKWRHEVAVAKSIQKKTVIPAKAGIQNNQYCSAAEIRRRLTESLITSYVCQPVLNKDFKVIFIDCTGEIKVCTLTIIIA